RPDEFSVGASVSERPALDPVSLRGRRAHPHPGPRVVVGRDPNPVPEINVLPHQCSLRRLGLRRTPITSLPFSRFVCKSHRSGMEAKSCQAGYSPLTSRTLRIRYRVAWSSARVATVPPSQARPRIVESRRVELRSAPVLLQALPCVDTKCFPLLAL